MPTSESGASSSTNNSGASERDDGRKAAKRKRQLSAEQINNMSQEEMRQVLLQDAATTLLRIGEGAESDTDDEPEGDPPDEEVIQQEIWKEVRKLRKERKQDRKELAKLRTECSELCAECSEVRKNYNELKGIVVGQQRFIEQLDNKDRECNIIITGLKEDAIDDKRKCETVMQKIGKEGVEISNLIRLGEARADGTGRPILAKVKDRATREGVIRASRALKREQGSDYEKVFVKKDLHPAVRKEWKRLHDCKDAEQAKPENAGKNVFLDFKKREVRCDNIVIDKWSPLSYFQ